MIEIFTRSKPHRKNDDSAGYEGNTCWLMDGATQLTAPEHGLDAAWHVNALNKAFRQIIQSSPDISLAELARKAIIETAIAFVQVTGLTEKDPQELRPFSTLILCRKSATELEYLVICDSTLAIIGPNGEQTVSDRRIDKGDPLKALYALLHRGHDFLSDAFKEEMQNLYRQTFARLNKPVGFDVVGQDASVIDRAYTGRLPVGADDHILLMSDGFTRAVDTLGLYNSWNDVLAALLKNGGDAFLDEIRVAEKADYSGEKHPRSSVHDDATLLWIKP